MSQDIEVWKQVFQELIQEVKPWHRWTLELDKDLQPYVPEQGWTQYKQWTFARFRCSFCSRSWASAQVQVLFHMHWRKRKSRGRVKMRIFFQRCHKCSQPQFEVPEFTQENISRVLSNLVFRILKKCYREGFESMEEIPTIKDISLEGPHDSNNCEACLQDFCAWSRLDLGLKPLIPSSQPAPSKNSVGPRVTATLINIRHSQPSPETDKFPGPTVYPEVSKPSKAASAAQISSISKPSTAPRYPTQQVSPISSPTLGIATQMPSPPNSNTREGAVTGQAGLKKGKVTATHIDIPHSQPSPKTDKLPGLTVYPKVSKPSKAASAPQISSISKPSTSPRYPTQQVSPISSPTLGIATQMPSPPNNNTREGAVTGQAGLKRGNVSIQIMNIPTSWSPRADTSCQLERRVQLCPSGQEFCYHVSQHTRNRSICCCCLIFIVVVVIVIKTTIL
ncbi:receptor-transporting protein 3 [Choloepus didactylus]|uniref:receptor-transporting protein 3 n=1 Tax=Choloepus didactylus TaxID=27675 RepID=UPI0018A03343|nr:receptor-transporting protein 3 [Choloepus didactylus]XP_037705240.1 receptor-transporting protein 3 [Choloepus didactylus]XP_037705248.1 receptor-transporting protein 3 [Choloepus didactylus]